MTDKVTQLTEDAVAALRLGHYIEAIKLTRTANHLGLKEAKDLVEAYLLEHSEIIISKPQLSQEKTLRLIVIILSVALLFWFYLNTK